MSRSEITVVAAIIYNSKNKILITKRPTNMHLGGLWEFPGGKVESGESYPAALKREIKEETNLDITVRDLYWNESVDYSKKKVHLYFYNCNLIDENQKILCNEIDDFRWLDKSELANFNFPEADVHLIKNLMLHTGL